MIITFKLRYKNWNLKLKFEIEINRIEIFLVGKKFFEGTKRSLTRDTAVEQKTEEAKSDELLMGYCRGMAEEVSKSWRKCLADGEMLVALGIPHTEEGRASFFTFLEESEKVEEGADTHSWSDNDESEVEDAREGGPPTLQDLKGASGDALQPLPLESFSFKDVATTSSERFFDLFQETFQYLLNPECSFMVGD